MNVTQHQQATKQIENICDEFLPWGHFNKYKFNIYLLIRLQPEIHSISIKFIHIFNEFWEFSNSFSVWEKEIRCISKQTAWRACIGVMTSKATFRRQTAAGMEK